MNKKAANKKNKRCHPRIQTKNFWIIERNDDFEYHLQATDLSLGGIFLAGRAKGSALESELLLPLPSGNITIKARAVYDRISHGNLGNLGTMGIGFKFSELTPQQLKALRVYLRELD